MIQVPQIQLPAGKPAQADAEIPSGEEGVFALILDAVGSELPPAELRAAVLEQVEQGMPLDQVLADLVRRLEEDTELMVPAGMMPSLNAAVQELADGEAALLAQFTERRGLMPQPSMDKSPVAEAVQTSTEPSGELDLELLTSELPVKDKALSAGRAVLLSEAVTNLPTALGPQQLSTLRPMEFAQNLGSMLAAATDADGAESLPLQPRVGDAGWGQALAQRVIWMIGRDQQTAQLRLNPAELGPLEVKLTMQQDQASVSLVASNGAVRDALEQALPRLRDMLGQQDIQLVQVNVAQRDSSGGQQASAQHGGGDAGHPGGGGPATGGQDEPPAETVRLQGRGLVDTYA
jgi:flagellar hook-length control protein FliK